MKMKMLELKFLRMEAIKSVYQQVRSVDLIEAVVCNLSLWGSFSNSVQLQKTT